MTAFVTLMYHDLAESPSSTYDVTPRGFQAQVDWLISEGYVIEGFDGLEKRLVSGEWPNRYVVATFDDGHRSNLQAAEILSKAGGRATFFIAKQFCQTRHDYMNDAEIAQLAGLCHIGSHSVSHSNMTKMPLDQVRFELVESKVWLESITGAPVTTFSAPFGTINVDVIRVAHENGYTLLGNSVEWWNSPASLKASRIVNRIAIRHAFPLSMFKSIIERDRIIFWKRRIRSGLLAVPKALLSDDQIQSLFVRFQRS